MKAAYEFMPGAERHHCCEKVSSQRQTRPILASGRIEHTSRLEDPNATIQRTRSHKIVG